MLTTQPIRSRGNFRLGIVIRKAVWLGKGAAPAESPGQQIEDMPTASAPDITPLAAPAPAPIVTDAMNPSATEAATTDAHPHTDEVVVSYGERAVLHSHIPGRDEGMQDDTNHGRGLGDAQPISKGLTNGTVMGDRLGVHEQVNGTGQFRMIDGKMTPQEQKAIQQNLNNEQKLLP